MGAKQAILDAWLHERPAVEIGPDHFAALLQLLAPIAESDLRHRLRTSGRPLHPLVAGVDQDSFPALRHSLSNLSGLYAAANSGTRRQIRGVVITAKDHAKLAAHNQRVDAAKRDRKTEMVNWMLTWLENPEIFPIWAEIRIQSLKLD